MTRPEQQRNWTGAWVAMALMIGSLVIALRTPALAQTYQVIHTFTGGDGETPAAGLTPDGHGNFYGTTLFGGTHNRRHSLQDVAARIELDRFAAL